MKVKAKTLTGLLKEGGKLGTKHIRLTIHPAWEKEMEKKPYPPELVKALKKSKIIDLDITKWEDFKIFEYHHKNKFIKKAEWIMIDKNPKRCTMTSHGGKCLVYEKIHTNEKAAKNHMAALKKRGAKVQKKKHPKGTLLVYNF